MSVLSIRHPEIFKVPAVPDGEALFGCDQEWYASEWQRLSGCGPTAASNLIYYLARTKPRACRLDVQSNKAGCLSLMETVWNYVTPTEEGVDTTTKFAQSLQAWFNASGIGAEARICDIPEDVAPRPALDEVLRFLARAMESDAPVAFLNLNNGDEEKLEAWHWVTVVSIEYSENEKDILLNILDESRIKKISLSLWYSTTTLGGGFVWFGVVDE
jgi:hypothetical protein